MNERSFKAEIRVIETTERPHKPLYCIQRTFGYVLVGDYGGKDDRPEYVRVTIVRELSKLFADSVVTVTVDEEIK